MEIYPLTWKSITTFSGIRYRCGYCGTDTSPAYGWYAQPDINRNGYVLVCTYCNKPSFIDFKGKIQNTTPAVKMGEEVKGLPSDVEILYNDARKCTSAESFTSAVLTCRKILMHIAVEKGAPTGKSFVEYVDYLAQHSYIPLDGKDWVDYIRSKSNEANHEIEIMEKADAEDLITFTEMLLRIIYEFKTRLAKSGKETKVNK